ncbi:uncharacterized protein F4812DRAFT_456691 [Daldinia caldariorum]|uniref:uncharacterized protein n=1 Tax=Daldinia caldariorum TaxID=326644 RepID=UPI002007CB6E|nr:uncharacterized protein F4812DRAFT_456691 [Daldinia caldariorum]KAI1470680.1 hypothetical protein F4812DRAFT_456691 [Daldinia caldariorum]
MAKSRRNRAKGGQRSDPIAKPVKPPSDPELAAIREKSILPVLKDLQSSEPKSRTAAAGAIANIVQDAKCRKLLLREKIVHIILNETLTDASLESRAAGWEILRILTAEEEADFCIHLYRVDVLTAIQHACAKIATILTSTSPVFSKAAKAEQAFTWSIAESLVAILSALAEAQDEALDAATRNAQILRFLFTLVTLDFTTAPVLNGALSCMITLSEDNKQFAEALLADKTTKCYDQLIAFKNGGGYKAVLACGVLHNVFSMVPWNDHSPGNDDACDAVLIPTLSRTLEHTQLNGEMANGDSSTSPAEVLQLALEILASIGTTLQQTLESGNKRENRETNADAVDADIEEDLVDHESDEEEGEDEEMDQDEMEADMEMVTGADADDELQGIDDLPTLRELIQKAVPQIVKLVRATGGDDQTSELIRGHALTALNNISWTVSCIDFTEKSNAAILHAWTPAASMIWQQIIAPVLASNTSDVELATIVTSLAWAIARTLHGQTFLGGDEQKKFISLYHASKNLDSNQEDPFQGLGVKCIGVLGQLALIESIALNREIGIFLLTVVKGLPETPAADAVEALNQLFDIYGDEHKPWDREVFWTDNFLQHLEEVAPKVKAMVKTIDKRQSTELRVRAEEANLNLSRFVRYKQKHKPEQAELVVR